MRTSTHTDWVTCPKCSGTGVVSVEMPHAAGSVECDRCDGSGEIRYLRRTDENAHNVDSCPVCGPLNSVDESWGDHVYQFHPGLVVDMVNGSAQDVREELLKRSKKEDSNEAD